MLNKNLRLSSAFVFVSSCFISSGFCQVNEQVPSVPQAQHVEQPAYETHAATPAHEEVHAATPAAHSTPSQEEVHATPAHEEAHANKKHKAAQKVTYKKAKSKKSKRHEEDNKKTAELNSGKVDTAKAVEVVPTATVIAE